MDKIKIILITILFIVLLSIIFCLAFIKIDYYEQIPTQIEKDNVFVILNDHPDSIFINVNQKIYEVNKYEKVNNNLYVLDFLISKEAKDKVFCFKPVKVYNLISYIFKVVFNI